MDLSEIGLVSLNIFYVLLEIFGLILMGMIFRKKDILDRPSTRSLSKIVTNIMLPSSFLTVIGGTFSYEHITSAWPVPVFVIINVGTSFLLCLMFTKLLKPSTSSLLILTCICASIPNINSYPFPLIRMITNEILDPNESLNLFILASGYANMYTACINFCNWGIFFTIMSTQIEKEKSEKYRLRKENEEISTGNYPLIAIQMNSLNSLTSPIEDNEQENSASQGNLNDINSSTIRNGDTTSSSTENKKTSDTLKPVSTIQNQISSNKWMELLTNNIIVRGYNKLPKFVHNAMNGPTIGITLAIIIACIPPIQNLIFRSNGALSFLGNIIERLGAGVIACLFIVGGANLTEGYTIQKLKENWRYIFVISFIRLFFMAILGGVLIYISKSIGILPQNNPALLLVLLINFGMPPNIGVILMIQIYQVGQEQLLPAIFWCYIFSSLTIFIFIISFLFLGLL